MAVWILAAACVLPLIWIGDAPFINDEPLLMAAAVEANSRGALAAMGLLGTFGFSYGPAPTWMYQALLAVTHDLVLVASLHAALIATATACALWWLSRSMRLWVWFAPIPLLSPYFWFYARVLWDNPLLIPLGALAIAGYASHLRSGSAAGLRVSLVAMATIPLVHLMGLALVVPLAAHMALVRRRSLWDHRFSVAATALASLVAARRYWIYLATSPLPASGPASGFDGWLLPFFGARLLSAGQLDYFFGAGPVEGPALGAAAAVSALAYALAWSGIGVAVWRVVRAVRLRDWSARDHVASILLGALACQSVLDGFSGKFQHPQYQNATWIVTVLLAWFAVDLLAEQRTRVRLTAPAASALLGGALVIAVAVVSSRLHRTGGTREIYGPTLANQQHVAQSLAQYSARSRLSSEVILYQQYPHTLAILRQMNPPGVDRPEADLELRYTSGNPAFGRIQLLER